MMVFIFVMLCYYSKLHVDGRSVFSEGDDECIRGVYPLELGTVLHIALLVAWHRSQKLKAA